MSTNDVSDGVCVVCFKPIEIYSIGDCDHPVCFECSTRMRVLCLQTECPICRHDISKVIFTSQVALYKNVLSVLNSKKKILYDDKYKILFLDNNCKEAYHKLLEHYCKKCNIVFRSFEALKDHMSKDHDFYFCHLCVDNLKIFTNERKFYTRQQLAIHKRKGDPDDTSHKGHPLCEFCDTRYMDTDELFRHLRKDHLYCHFCDADGFHQYYVSFHTLRDHFRKDHYLCEEGDCSSEGNMTVFRTDIDFKAHKASEHGRGLSKQAARQARTLELQFTLTPRPSQGISRTHPRTDRLDVENSTENSREVESEVEVVENTPTVDMDSIKQFPTLGDSGPPVTTLTNRPDKTIYRQTAQALARTDENFPALSSETPLTAPGPSTSFRLNITHPGPSTAVIRTNVKPNVCIQVHNQSQSSASNGTNTRKKQVFNNDEGNLKFMDDFPQLSKKDKNLLLNDYTSYSNLDNSSTKKGPNVAVSSTSNKMSQSLANKAPPSLDAFPALQTTCSLAATSSSPAQPKWIAKIKPKESSPKQQPKPKIQETQAPMPFVNNLSEFPTPPPTSGIQWTNAKKGKYENTPQPQWTNLKFKEPTPKPSKVAPAPVIPAEPALNISDFPSLKPKQKKKQNREAETDVNDNIAKTKDIGSKGKTPNKDSNRNNKKKINNSIENSNSTMKQESCVEINVPSNEIPSSKLNGSKFQLDQVAASNKFLDSKVLPDFSLRNSNVKKRGSNSNTPPCNGFTFTNSSGQNYDILAHNFIQPINFNERNKALVSKFMEILGETEAIHEFKLYSQLFREGNYSAEHYYKHCMESMKEGFKDMFPELLVLLPDIRKQQELHKVHMLTSGCSLHICDTCGQVLIAKDVQYHKDFHAMQTAFPALGPPSHTVNSKHK